MNATGSRLTLPLRYRIRHFLRRFDVDALAASIGRRLIRWSQRDSNYLRHARSEWAIAFPGEDDMQRRMGEHVLDMVAMFGTEGHSGFSASYAQHYIDKALRFQPFSPLTGEESEWGEPFETGGSRQNRRCGRVFLGADGVAYDIDGKVFEEPDGARYTSIESRAPVTFPYVPTTEIVKVQRSICDETEGDCA